MKARSRLSFTKRNRKAISYVKTLSTGILLGSYVTACLLLGYFNMEFRALGGDRPTINQCTENLCRGSLGVPASPAKEGDNGIVLRVEASEVKTATVTAYSCGGLETLVEIRMNCPSLLTGSPKTASGTEPVPYRTMACDKANMGRTFWIEGVGEATCTDTGGAITGRARFDLYLPTVDEARQWGVKELAYELR